ncbi:MAG: alpha-amylase family glycosyl hydrolase [Clostridia bacterium]|nr:alpha-amylase family glycosyl hydrolase [Clostridia bacterium]
MKSDTRTSKYSIYYNSRQTQYKTPFGPLAAKKDDLKLRISAKEGEIKTVKVEIVNGTGTAFYFDMKKSFSVDGKDFFEVTISRDVFTQPGIWKYKFLLVSGNIIFEYGKYDLFYGDGVVAEKGAKPFELSVYDANLKTPEWIKNAVIYQILVDRFFDGCKVNNVPKALDNIWDELDKKPFHEAIKEELQNKGLDGEWNDSVFNSQNIFFGGDIQGIKEKLDYLLELGINVLYLNPIAWSRSNHKYNASDLKYLDPCYGMPVFNEEGCPSSGINYSKTREASDNIFAEFAQEAEKRGIKIILDGVFNHVGDDSVYFDAYEKYPEIGAYKFWSRVWDKVNKENILINEAVEVVIKSFTRTKNPLTGKNYVFPDDFEFIYWFDIKNKKLSDDESYQYECWARNKDMPVIASKLPQDNDPHSIPGLHKWNNESFREHVFGHDLENKPDAEAEKMMKKAAAQKWIWLGASGWRMDAVPDISIETWRKFRQSMRTLNGKKNINGKEINDVVIIGELWPFAPEHFLGDVFDSVTNYKFKEALESFIINGNAENFHNLLETIREIYPDEICRAAMNLLGSHDTPRAVTNLSNSNSYCSTDEADENMLKKLCTAVIFQIGYPGAPVIYYGDEVGLEGSRDPDNRRPFPWNRVFRNNSEYCARGKYSIIFYTFKKAINIRRNHDVFVSGEIKLAFAEDDVITYALKNNKEVAIVAINRSESEKEILAKVNKFFPDGTLLRDHLSTYMNAIVENGELRLIIPPQYGLMMTGELNLLQIPKVRNIKVLAGNKKVQLEWDKVNAALSYNIYRSLTPFGINDDEYVWKIAEVSSNELKYLDIGLQNGLKYFYYVTAVNGMSESTEFDNIWAIPHIKPCSVEFEVPCKSLLPLGVGNRTTEGEIRVSFDSTVCADSYSDDILKGLVAELCYYNVEKRSDDLCCISLYAKKFEEGRLFFSASFEPDTSGVYIYYARVSTDNGISFYESDVNSLVVCQESHLDVHLTSPNLNKAETTAYSTYLKWDSGDKRTMGYEIYKCEQASNYKRIAVLPSDNNDFTDLAVKNGNEYRYKIAAFNKNYSRVYSEEVIVRPEFLPVDVTINVHLPLYTPSEDEIYIREETDKKSPRNHKMSSVEYGNDKNVRTFNFKALPGTEISYCYNRGTEFDMAFISSKRKPHDSEDKANWAYFDFSNGLSMYLVIENQGKNKMIINDYIIRWLDMPLIILEPAFSFGKDISFETFQDMFKLKVNIPNDVILSINDIPVDELYFDSQGNVQIDNIPLVYGKNIFSISTTRSIEIKDKPWYQCNDSDLCVCKTIKIEVTRLLK